MVELLGVLLVLALIVALPLVLGRGRRTLFRGKDSGGGSGGMAGAFSILDRITRPTIEHVEKMEDRAEDEERIDGE